MCRVRRLATGTTRFRACRVRIRSAVGTGVAYATLGDTKIANIILYFNDFTGEPGGTRTHGPKIKSLVLYQLSYGLTPAG
jgi:hypothetical protein